MATHANSIPASNVIALDVAAVLRLASATTGLKTRVDEFLRATGDQFEPAHRSLRDSLIAFLDLIEGDPDMEMECEDEGAADDREREEQDADTGEWSGRGVHAYA